jgi:hypothetical protein
LSNWSPGGSDDVEINVQEDQSSKWTVNGGSNHQNMLMPASRWQVVVKEREKRDVDQAFNTSIGPQVV